MNVVTLIGNLGKDPEVRQLSSGNAVANLAVATSERYTKDGEKVEKTQWHNVTVWGRTAENCAKYLSKGSKIGLTGKIEYDKVESDDGSTKYYTKIVAQSVEFLSSKGVDSQGADDLPF